MTEHAPPQAAKIARRRRSDVRAAAKAERDTRIAHWVAKMPAASNERIAAKAGTTARAVAEWRQRQRQQLSSEAREQACAARITWRRGWPVDAASQE